MHFFPLSGTKKNPIWLGTISIYIMTINFACVIWHTSQDRTSWTSHFKLQESYKMEGTCFSGTFHFIRFLQFKVFIMLAKEPLFGFSGLASEKPPLAPSNPGSPSKGFLSLYIADTRHLISCRTQRGGWWIHGKNFYFRKINIKDMRRTVDPQQELLLQKMNIEDCEFSSPTQLPFSTTIIMSMQTEFHQNRNQKSLIYKPTTHRGKSCILMRDVRRNWRWLIEETSPFTPPQSGFSYQ